MTAPADPRLEAAACEVYLWINGEQTKMPPEGYIKAAARVLAAADAVDPLRQLQAALANLAARQDRLGAEFEAAIYSDLDSLYEDGPLRQNDGGADD